MVIIVLDLLVTAAITNNIISIAMWRMIGKYTLKTAGDISMIFC